MCGELRRMAVGGELRRMAVGGGGGGGGGPSSGIVCEIVNWKLIGGEGRELEEFGFWIGHDNIYLLPP